MSNIDNLRKIDTEIARDMQKKSVEARKRNKQERINMRLALEELLNRDMKSKDGQDMSGAEAISAKLFEQALKGDIRAYETIRATVGQDPVQKVQVAEIDKHVEEEIEGLIDEIEKGDS